MPRVEFFPLHLVKIGAHFVSHPLFGATGHLAHRADQSGEFGRIDRQTVWSDKKHRKDADEQQLVDGQSERHDPTIVTCAPRCPRLILPAHRPLVKGATVSDWDLIHRFATDYLADSEDVGYLQEASIEHGIHALGPVTGGTIQAIARATGATSIIEVGTGVGVTTMRLAEACPDAHITSIDSEPDHHVTLKELMAQLPLEASKLRLITERAQDVLHKMNQDSYDLVVIDVPASELESCYDDAVTLCRPGGSVVIARALVGGAIADPANRDAQVSAMRTVAKTVAEDDRVSHTLLPMAEGLLWVQVHATPGD